MCDPLPLGKKAPRVCSLQASPAKKLIKNNTILFVALMLTVFGLMLRLFETRSALQVAKAAGNEAIVEVKSPLFEEENQLFELDVDVDGSEGEKYGLVQSKTLKNGSNKLFAQKIYDLVGDAPIKEMVPFISERDDKVAAFLIGIAKKESSFGYASPSKDGIDCYNYWGYKGSAGRGTGMGYACFASAEEAVEVVGNRIEVLVNKNRSTPAKMVDTWKCGTSCKGDPGAPSWVSTVALYFDKIVEKNS
ncbi:MAG: hypothetical protein ACD_56C00059G0001 [uncultured bacterium]|nr:MAG: hypothetical protein ACD_56C00059G0001 [uncultured bacterium]